MNDTYLNSDSVCEGLKKLRHQNPDEWLYVILDNAAYQRCKKVKDCAAELNINLVYLPPYSPNLNLIERLWKFLRSKILANKYYDSFKTFFSEVHDFLSSVHVIFADSLNSLLSFNFQCLDSNACFETEGSISVRVCPFPLDRNCKALKEFNDVEYAR